MIVSFSLPLRAAAESIRKYLDLYVNIIYKELEIIRELLSMSEGVAWR